MSGEPLPEEADTAESIRSGVQERLASLDGLATPEHVAVFDEVQAELGAMLDRLDGAAGQRSAEQG